LCIERGGALDTVAVKVVDLPASALGLLEVRTVVVAVAVMCSLSDAEVLEA